MNCIFETILIMHSEKLLKNTYFLNFRIIQVQNRVKMTSRENIPGRRWSCFALLLILLIGSSSQAAENLLSNPGFELGNTSGWKTWGCSLTAVRNQAHSGNY